MELQFETAAFGIGGDAFGHIVNRANQVGAPPPLVNHGCDSDFASFEPRRISCLLLPGDRRASDEGFTIEVQYQRQPRPWDYLFNVTTHDLRFLQSGRAKKGIIDRQKAIARSL